MKKTWVITLIVFGLLFAVQQAVLSKQQTKVVLTPILTPTLTLTPTPGITNPPDELVISMSSIHETTPIPTHTPTSTLTPTPTPTPTYIPTPTTPSGNTGGIISNSPSLASQFQNWLQSTFGNTTPTPTKTPTITNTPAPTLPRSTNTPTPRPTPTDMPTPVPLPTDVPLIAPTSTPIPQQPTNIPTPLPTDSILPNSLTAQKTTTEKKTTYILDTHVLAEIKIVPNAFAAENAPTEKPLLPQEQKLLAENSSPTAGGILVSLEQKAGNTFVTRQDELTVKRGNQFFTISNQPTTPQPQKEENAPSGGAPSTMSSSRLEINANNVIAQSSMNLSVDPLNGILTVETPSGPQKVSIMPDETLGIVVGLKALNAGGKTEPSILLVSENGALVYRVSGTKVEKFLGFFPLSIQKQILISADTGSIIKVELSPLSQFLSFFTF